MRTRPLAYAWLRSDAGGRGVAEVSALVETVHPEHQGEAWEGADDSDALLLRFQGGKLGIHSTTLTTPPRRDMCYIEGSVKPAAISGVVALDPHPQGCVRRLKHMVVVHRTEGRIMIDSLEFGGESISLETPDGGIESVPVEPLAEGLFDSKSRPLSGAMRCVAWR